MGSGLESLFQNHMWGGVYDIAGSKTKEEGIITVHLTKFKPCLKIVAVSTVNIVAKPAKVTKYNLCIQGYIRVTCHLL